MLFVIVFTFSCLLYAQQSPARWWRMATEAQRQSIIDSYKRNVSYDKGYTLAAFNAIESAGGLLLINESEKSGGLYAQKAYTVAKRINKQLRLGVPLEETWKYPYAPEDEPNKIQIDMALNALVYNQQFDEAHARVHLVELLVQYNGNWMEVWRRWNSQKPGQAEQVREWIRFLQGTL